MRCSTFLTMALVMAANAMAAHWPTLQGIRTVELHGQVTLSVVPTSHKVTVPEGVVFDKVDDRLLISYHGQAEATLKLPATAMDQGVEVIVIKDTSRMMAKKWRARHLHIDNQSSVDSVLSGVMGIDSIHQAGKGHLEVYWIDAPKLQVDASEGQVLLGGVVGQLHLNASSQAQVDAHGLRSKHAWVSIRNQAFAKVNAAHFLAAFGEGSGLLENYGATDYVSEVMNGESALVHVTL